jgi:hypothetical protein
MDEVRDSIKVLEGATGQQYGSNANPLLLTVRSGAVSTPCRFHDLGSRV